MTTHIAEIFSPRARAMTDQARAPMTATPTQMTSERLLGRRVSTSVAVTGILPYGSSTELLSIPQAQAGGRIGGAPRPLFATTVQQFTAFFSSEEAYESYFECCRWPDGFVCVHGRLGWLSGQAAGTSSDSN
jgi:hypothetical protein